jgi:hypothetical protein
LSIGQGASGYHYEWGAAIEINGDVKMAVTMNWGALGLGSVVAFLIGWFLFGLLGAIILAVIVLILMGILVIK